MIAASIGLIAQIYNLDGGWKSFALSWAILSIPFVLLSRFITFNIIWILLLSTGIEWDFLEKLLKILDMPLTAIITGTILFGVFSYLAEKLYIYTKKKIMLFHAFSRFALFCMYFTAVIFGGNLGMSYYYKSAAFANAFVFIFLAIRMTMSFLQKDMNSFRNNALITECYILWFFVSRFGNLLISGLGFIVGGILLLAFIYLLKHTSKHIKTMEAFNEK